LARQPKKKKEDQQNVCEAKRICQQLTFCPFLIIVSSHDPGLVLGLEKIGQNRASIKNEMLAARWVFHFDFYLKAFVSQKPRQK